MSIKKLFRRISNSRVGVFLNSLRLKYSKMKRNFDTRLQDDVELPASHEAIRKILLGRMRAGSSSSSLSLDDDTTDAESAETFQCNSESDYVEPDRNHIHHGRFFHPQFNGEPAINVGSQFSVSTSSLGSENCSAFSKSGFRISFPRRSHFQQVFSAKRNDVKYVKEEETADPYVKIYSEMNFTQAKAEARIYGNLKQGKEYFVSKLFPHIGQGKGDSKPTRILSIKKCRCRPVATPQRVAKKLSKSTFELFYTEDECFQFTVSSPREMAQWVSMVRQLQAIDGDGSKINKNQNESSNEITIISHQVENSQNSNSNEDYVVIHDIALALANPGQNPKPNPLTSPTKKSEQIAKTDKQKTENRTTPLNLQTIRKNLPLPPVPPRPLGQTNNDALMYEIVAERNTAQDNSSEVLKQGNLSTSGSREELYDDVDSVDDHAVIRHIIVEAQDTMKMKKNALRKDDVNSMKIKARMFRGNGKNKLFKQGPRVPIRTAPLKTFSDELRPKSESSEIEELADQVQINSYLEQTVHEPGILIEHNSMRIINGGKSFSSDFIDKSGESLCDDIGNVNPGFNKHKPIAESESGTRKENDNFQGTRRKEFAEDKNFETWPSMNCSKNVSCNLNEHFDVKICKNRRSRAEDIEDYSVDYEEIMVDDNVVTDADKSMTKGMS